MQKGNNDDNEKDLKMIYCANCGKPMGLFADEATCTLKCSKCKRDVVISVTEGRLLLGLSLFPSKPVTN